MRFVHVVGLEPTASRLSDECSNQLSYTCEENPLVWPATGIEPVTDPGLNPALYL